MFLWSDRNKASEERRFKYLNIEMLPTACSVSTDFLLRDGCMEG